MLTPEQEASAVRYNRAQWGEGTGRTGLQCRRIQRTVRVEPDGWWGPITVNAAAEWQLAHGLVADGKVGPATSGIMVASCDDLRVSVWSKRSLSDWTDHADEYVEALRAVDAENVALMLNRQKDTTWSLSRWGNDIGAVKDWGSFLEHEGFAVTFTAWPRSDPHFLEAMVADLHELVGPNPGIASDLTMTWAEIELDVEGYNWPDNDESNAAAFELERMLRWQRPMDMWPEVSITTHPARMHPGYTVTTTGDQLSVQAYSYYGPPERAWCAEEGPGQRQVNAIEACWKVIGSRRRPGQIVVGLAAYDQAYPESSGCGAARSGSESILEALYASLAHRQTRVRFWELKYCVQNAYVAEAIAEYQEFRDSTDDWLPLDS